MARTRKGCLPASPVRIHFRSADGRYLPPYGHPYEINDNFFEDYGADCKLGSTQYAYIDGRCQVELPVGDVYVEVVADLILGKADALELLSDLQLPTPDTSSIVEWYRFLNCGCRVAAVGSTDKMHAGMPVGGVRTYALLGDEEFNYANWARAVKAGQTFTTTEPLLDLGVEGHGLGARSSCRRAGAPWR